MGERAGAAGKRTSIWTAARGVERAKPFRWLVRTGFVARGITYGVIGGLALAIAVGAGTLGAAPDQQGALALISRTAPGRASLVVIVAGLLAYALWKLGQGFLGRDPDGGRGPSLRDRVSDVAGGAAYLVFAVVAIRVLEGSAGNSASDPRSAAAGVLDWPGGQAIVAIAGAALIAISLFQLYEGLAQKFARDSQTAQMGGFERRLFAQLGRIGIGARALVFALVGYFLLRTAIDYNPREAVGVDGALARLHHEPLGPWLLGLVAVGLMLFAAFSLLEARYRRL